MPRAQGTNLEMALILEYLDSMDDFAIKGIGYDTDGHNSIYKKELILTKSDGHLILPSDTEQELYRMCFLSQSGKFRKYYYQKPDKGKAIYETSDKRRQEAQRYIDEVIDPIVKKLEKKPNVNLQWLFNAKYQKRFSK